MISEEKEEVPLKDIISVQQANGAVEKWLLQVEAAMFDNIAYITGEGIKSYGAKPRDQWVLDWPGMVVLVVTAVFWTKQVTEAISDGTRAVGKYEEKCTKDLMNIVDRVRGELTGTAPPHHPTASYCTRRQAHTGPPTLPYLTFLPTAGAHWASAY